MTGTLRDLARRALIEAGAEATRLLGGSVPSELLEKWQAQA
jgi:hypothetical protein